MEGTYERKLSHSEEERHYVYIESGAPRKLLGPASRPLKIRIGKKEYQVVIDSSWRILGAVFKGQVHFKEGRVFVFRKNQDGSFSLGVKK